jgi:hypothetical protein
MLDVERKQAKRNRRLWPILLQGSAAIPPVAAIDVVDEGEPSVRPDDKKVSKQKLKQRLTIEALHYPMVKKNEADN